MTTKKISASALRHDEARTCSASAADRLIIARNAGRPTTREYIREMFDDFFEQAGDHSVPFVDLCRYLAAGVGQDETSVLFNRDIPAVFKG